MDNLYQYIIKNRPVIVTYRTRFGYDQATVNIPDQLPFDAKEIGGTGSLYLFSWDRIGKPIDYMGNLITEITAIPANQVRYSESRFPL